MLTVAQAAKILRVSCERVRQFIRSGRLAATMFGQRTYLILYDDLRAFQRSRRKP